MKNKYNTDQVNQVGKNTKDIKDVIAQKGAVNGITPLNGSTKIDPQYLPSYVDDVLEVINFLALPATGETGKIYVIIDTNKTYRWSGAVYIEISQSITQIQSDWNQTNNVQLDFIKNKPVISSGTGKYEMLLGLKNQHIIYPEFASKTLYDVSSLANNYSGTNVIPSSFWTDGSKVRLSLKALAFIFADSSKDPRITLTMKNLTTNIITEKTMIPAMLLPDTLAMPNNAFLDFEVILTKALDPTSAAVTIEIVSKTEWSVTNILDYSNTNKLNKNIKDLNINLSHNYEINLDIYLTSRSSTNFRIYDCSIELFSK